MRTSRHIIRQNKWSLLILILWFSTGIFSPLLVNKNPIICKLDGKYRFTLFNDFIPNDCIPVLEPLIGYDYHSPSLIESNKPPFSKGIKGIHWLGTDHLGRDIFAGMIRGSYVSLNVAGLTLIISLFFGFIIGLPPGYYNNNGIRLNLIQLILMILTVVLSVYYFSIWLQVGSLFEVIALIITIGLGTFLIKLSRILPLRSYGLPLDGLFIKVIEIRSSIPILFFILVLLSVFEYHGIWTLIVVISIFTTLFLSRFIRAETQKLSQEPFVQAGIAIGLSDVQLFRKYLIPQILRPLMVIISFAVSSIILMESTLSFLGIGLPVEEVSWGSILAQARQSPKSWWLALFPGIAIFLIISALNRLADNLKA